MIITVLIVVMVQTAPVIFMIPPAPVVYDPTCSCCWIPPAPVVMIQTAPDVVIIIIIKQGR